MTMAEALCCTLLNCSCDNFKPGKLKRRQCEHCKHGWVAHALSKLKVHHMYQSSQVEIVHSNVVFDICSLMLYGTQAIPIRLKILLDRLFSVLKQEEVIKILNALDWTLQDYIRGYVIQDVAGKVLDRWTIMTFEEEIATLQHFLRFGETKSIVELMALQDKEGQAVLVPSTRTISDIRTFIERNTPRPATNLSTAKAEKQNGNNMHHFENFINGMAFMLPFQLLSSIPAPFLGSPAGPHQQLHQQHQKSCHGSVEHQSQRQDDQEQDNSVSDNPLNIPYSADSSHISSNSVILTADRDQGGDKLAECLSSTTKIEVEDFSMSDNYSDGPPTPSMISDVIQISPVGKLHNESSGLGISVGSGGGGSLKKGRVFCNACEKTFYDKGTLKIHFNAVHLKIKHKCTIEGCNMVFSSLRSRNRHSANPNPRLHMPMNRNNRDKDIRDNLSADECSPGEKASDYVTSIPICSAESHKSVPSYMVNQVDGGSKMHSNSFPSIGQSTILFPNLKTVQPVLPFYRSLVTPAELANTPGTLPSLPRLSSSVSVKHTTVSDICNTDPIPKKKSRKSSMPIKIEKETIERDEQIDEGSNFEEAISLLDKDKQEYGSHRAEGQVCFVRAGIELTEKGMYFDENRESKSIKSFIHQTIGKSQEEHKDSNTHQVETVTTITLCSPLKKTLSKNLGDTQLTIQEFSCGEESDGKQSKNTQYEDDQVSKLKWSEYKHTNGTALQLLDHKKEGSESSVDCPDNLSLSDLDSNTYQFHHCEICSKTFKNSHRIKMHYQNVHLKDIHMCTVNGCSATFPSRRSRDRHSANLNLHHKLMTKELENQTNFLCTSSTHYKERDSVAMDRDMSHQEPICPNSVAFRGQNRMGLVYPMSKIQTPLESNETSHKAGICLLRGGSGEDGTVLDLSTSSCAPIHCSIGGRSCWDSDGVASEEGDGAGEDVEGFHMEDSDESSDDISEGRPRQGTLLHGGGGILICGGETQNGPQGGGSGSPITCHLCQKVYSNKGTFRAHYKTVHLKLLHKCKVPGCDTTFSSVRSRNRHSQNPNLHRNLVVSTGASIDQG
ncbi:zinc finger protein basonuclin-1-like [Syngnathoides biaculeatus]|uniref:zinc finger protein basonuclin-1-like n=1 Tax=Syngnathoides biaculeatus TaxID=300417 RepID=UPI002ADD385F|nr:zinc finger protein basonuclin-1-like [Syngnathoides biaculeatus]